MASETKTGIAPKDLPSFSAPLLSVLLLLVAQALPNAPMGPLRIARPNAISSITPVEAISSTNIR